MKSANNRDILRVKFRAQPIIRPKQTIEYSFAAILNVYTFIFSLKAREVSTIHPTSFKIVECTLLSIAQHISKIRHCVSFLCVKNRYP